MKRKNLLLTVALCLLMGAIAVWTANDQPVTPQATSITISSLPFHITAPGTYVLTSNLSYTTDATPPIFINSNIPGPVTLNLNGFTISGGAYGGSAIAIGSDPNLPNEYPVTIKNGTITHFGSGVFVSGSNVSVSKLTISDIQLAINATCILFYNTNTCTISNCAFSNGMFGIADQKSSQ